MRGGCLEHVESVFRLGGPGVGGVERADLVERQFRDDLLFRTRGTRHHLLV